MTSGEGEIRVSFSNDGTVATVLLDREPKLNTLTVPVLEQLIAACDEVEESSARVVLIRTAGTRAFCVGADITKFAELASPAAWSEWIAIGHRAFDRLAIVKQPTVAVVDGLALGGGLELALSCDLRVVSRDARLGLPEAGLGTVPGWGGTSRLTNTVGRARALEMMLTRRQLTADEALEWGLANRISDSSHLEGTVQSLIEDLLASAPIASQLIKQVVTAGLQGESARELETVASASVASTDDLREGIAAFREKRSPVFTGA